MTEPAAKFDEWAMLELFGHQRIAGRVTEATIGGGAFVRVDVRRVKGKKPKLTRFYNPSAIYSITPVAEDVARAAAEHMAVEPIAVWDVQELVKRGLLKLPATVEDEP